MSRSFPASTWFITGATGLVGSTVIEELRDNDLNVIALVRETSPKHLLEWLNDLDVKLVYGDLLNPESYKNYLATSDIVVHTAAAVQNRIPSENWKINRDGTKILCQSMIEMGVKRLIHLSTVGVYGKAYTQEVDEKAIPKPYGPYSQSKLDAENLILKEFPVINSTIIRPPFIFGAVERERHLYKTLIDRFPQRILPKVWRYDPIIGFVHAEDIARLVLFCGSREMTPSKIYNIQSFSIPLSRVLEMIHTARNDRPRTVAIPYSILYIGSVIMEIFFKIQNRTYGIRNRLAVVKKNWVFDTSLVHDELGFKPTHIDSSELEILLSQYYTGKYEGDSTEINIQDLLDESE